MEMATFTRQSHDQQPHVLLPVLEEQIKLLLLS